MGSPVARRSDATRAASLLSQAPVIWLGEPGLSYAFSIG